MPKEVFVIDKFMGMSPSTNGGDNPLVVKNMRLDVPLDVAVPENTNSVEFTDNMYSSKAATVEAYIDGNNTNIDVYRDGSLYVDGYQAGTLPVSGNNAQISQIGRSAIVIPGSSRRPYFVRKGFPSVGHLAFTRNEIVVERDRISSLDLPYGAIRKMVGINSDQVLYITGDDARLYMANVADGELSISQPIAGADSIVDFCISRDLVLYAIVKYPNAIKIALCIFSALYNGQPIESPEAFNEITFTSDPIFKDTSPTVSLGSTIPSGYSITSINVSANNLWISCGIEKAGLPFNVHAYPVGESNDIFFSISKSYIDTNDLLSIDNGKIQASTLPFMGYTDNPDQLSNTDRYFTGYSINNQTSVAAQNSYVTQVYRRLSPEFRGAFVAPHGSHKAIESAMAQLITDIRNKGGINPVGNQTHAYVPIPGSCGLPELGWASSPAGRTTISGFGMSVIIDYDNDIAAYPICSSANYPYGESGDALKKYYPTNAAPGGLRFAFNEVGTIGTFKPVFPLLLGYIGVSMYNATQNSSGSSAGLYIHVERYPLRNASTINSNTDPYKVEHLDALDQYFYTDFNDEYPEEQRSIMYFFAWNGIQPHADWPGYKYNLFSPISCRLGTTSPIDIYIKKCFDDKLVKESIPDPSISGHFRTLLVSNKKVCGYPHGDDGRWSPVQLVTLDEDNDPISFVAIGQPDENMILTSGINLPTADADPLDYHWDKQALDAHSSETVGNIELKTPTIPIAHNDTVFSSIVKDNSNTVVVGTFSYDFDVPIDEQSPEIEYSDDYDLTVDSECIALEDTPDADGITGSHRYRISFIYDGVTIGPLSSYRKDITLSEASFVTATIKLINVSSISKRITGVALFSAPIDGDNETEYYRLVEQVEVTSSKFSYNNIKDCYECPIVDSGSRLASFNAYAGYSETLRSISADRGCQTHYMGYLFIGDIEVQDRTTFNTSNVILRSLPLQPSAFNYPEDYCILQFKPNVLIGWSGRLYAFGSCRYSVINPDTLAIEGTSDLCGASTSTHVLATEYALFVYSSGHIYAINGLDIKDIGAPITKKGTLYGDIDYPTLSELSNVMLGFSKKRNALIIAGEYNGSVWYYGYHPESNRFSLYEIERTGIWNFVETERLALVYSRNDDTYICTEAYDEVLAVWRPRESRLFSGSGTKTMEITIATDLGLPYQPKYIYDIYTPGESLEDCVTINGSSYQPGTIKEILDVSRVTISVVTALKKVSILFRRLVRK